MKRLEGGILGVEGIFGGCGEGVSRGVVGGCIFPFDLFRAAKREGVLPELANTFSF